MRTPNHTYIVALVVLLAIQGAILIGYGLAAAFMDQAPVDHAGSVQRSEAPTSRTATPGRASQPAPAWRTTALIAGLIGPAVVGALVWRYRVRSLSRPRGPAPSPGHASEMTPHAPGRQAIEWTLFWMLAAILILASVVAGAILRIGFARVGA